MKVVCVLGSPRIKGNSEFLAETFLKSMQNLGAQTQTFALNKLKYRGCQACMACKKALENCAVKDDLNQVLDATREADVLVLASPVYYGDITSQAKAFIDRTFCYLAPDFTTNPKPSRLKPGKKFVFILTQNAADENMFADIYPKYKHIFQWYGFGDSHLIRATQAGEKDAVTKQTKVLEETQKLAQTIMSAK